MRIRSFRATRAFAWVALVGLIARRPVHKDAPQGSTQRRRLLALVTENPGLPVGAILEQIQMGWGTLYYHLSKLSKEGQIQVVRIGRRRLVYPTSGGKVAEFAPGDAILRGQTSRRIAVAIHDHPGCSIQDIVDEVHESVRVVYYHVRRLIEVGLVTSSSDTRHRDLRATPRLCTILVESQGEPEAIGADSQQSSENY